MVVGDVVSVQLVGGNWWDSALPILVKANQSQTYESVSQEIEIEDDARLQLDLSWRGEKLPQFVSRVRSSREIESVTYLRLFSMRTVLVLFAQ